MKIKNSEENISRKCIERIRLEQRFLRPRSPLLNTSIFARFAVLASLLSFAALPVVSQAATFGPGGGIPSPIGQNGNIAFGPGGGIPSPIGQNG